jgi:hypothetical protein
LGRHALNTCADANVNHASLDGIGNVDTSLEARGALSVQALDGGIGGESGGQSSGAELGSTASRGEDGTNGNVLNEARVDAGSLDEGLEGANEKVCGLGVFEAALAALGHGCSESAGDDDLDLLLLLYGTVSENKSLKLTSSAFFSSSLAFPPTATWVVSCWSLSRAETMMNV